MPAIEAMACGTTVVAIKNAGTSEIIDHGKNGFLADDSNFGAYIDRVLTDNTLRENLERNGLLTVHKIYDIQKIAREYEKTYESVLTL